MAPITNIDVISLATASLGAARSVDDDETKAFYAATARGALDALEENLRRLRLNLKTIEDEMVRRSNAKKLQEKNKNG